MGRRAREEKRICARARGLQQNSNGGEKNSKEHDEIGSSSFIHDFRESLEHCLNNSGRLLSSYINIPLINMYIM